MSASPRRVIGSNKKAIIGPNKRRLLTMAGAVVSLAAGSIIPGGWKYCPTATQYSGTTQVWFHNNNDFTGDYSLAKPRSGAGPFSCAMMCRFRGPGGSWFDEHYFGFPDGGANGGII